MSVFDSSAIEVNTFGFNLPCRQFLISAERTRERKLPMVDEFVLRVLHTVGRISPARLARFFGFEGRDVGIVIAELVDRNLVVFEGDDLALHPAAQELFRTSDASRPRLTSTERLDASVWFDLISKNLVAGRGLRRVRHLIDLRPPEGAAIESSDARSAFTSNFSSFLKLRGDRNVDQWTLYSILDTHPGRFSSAQIHGSERLSLVPDPKLETILPLSEFENRERGRKIQETITSQLRERGSAAPSQAAVTEFSKLTGSTFLRRKLRYDGTVDLSAFLSGDVESSGDWTPFVGSPYIERNRQLIAGLLAVRGGKESTLWWLRPGGLRWGLTEDLSATLELLRSRFRDAQSALTTTLVAPHLTKGVVQHQLLFDRGVHAASGGIALAIEALVIPDLLAAVSVMVHLSPSVVVPIGYATNERSCIRRVWEGLELPAATVAHKPLWSREKQSRADPN
ncbi:hypothetical protein [uncultured Stenotrophomonas sp.]|mgnify:FL=1|uniref:hypothetical protein n=1 Tax=uncultured Stenotrophomonas sp. TaxID=165438 RepID=UPI0025EE6068|nr:hypothetical protein [uncultured Stenotrophomonas sp.]